MKQLINYVKQLKILLLICFIFYMITVPATVSAAGFDYYGINTRIVNNELIESSISLEFDNTVTHLDYSLSFNIKNLDVTANFEDPNCRVVDTDKGSDITCDFTNSAEGKRFVTLSFETTEGVKREGNKYIFTASYDTPSSVNDIGIILKLPQRAALIDFFPSNPSTSYPNNTMTLLWDKEDLTDDKIQFSATYTMPFFDEEFYVLFVITITLVVIIVMISMILYIKKSPKRRNDEQKIEFRTEPMKIEEQRIETISFEQPKTEEVKTETKQHDEDRMRVVTSVLREDERKIVDILEKHEGKVIQKTLVRETDFSKAKVSRLVKNLKERGIVDAEPIGRTTKVTLKIKPIISEYLNETEKKRKF
ncbi:MAG: hypothetical protein KKG13_04430 [Nanoarchaeota archaeon]|nr:hypothetical protein [Nanoarchaeota archaeon]